MKLSATVKEAVADAEVGHADWQRILDRIIEPANPKVAGMDGAVRSSVDLFHALALSIRLHQGCRVLHPACDLTYCRRPQGCLRRGKMTRTLLWLSAAAVVLSPAGAYAQVFGTSGRCSRIATA
jgi:hypothetical protein